MPTLISPPFEPTCIFDHLWLGTIWTAKQLVVTNPGIGLVLNCTDETIFRDRNVHFAQLGLLDRVAIPELKLGEVDVPVPERPLRPVGASGSGGNPGTQAGLRHPTASRVLPATYGSRGIRLLPRIEVQIAGNHPGLPGWLRDELQRGPKSDLHEAQDDRHSPSGPPVSCCLLWFPTLDRQYGFRGEPPMNINHVTLDNGTDVHGWFSSKPI